MAGLNKVILIGHLGKDPESRALNNGGQLGTFSLATSESWRDKATGERQERTTWHQIVVFNEELGKIATQYLKKVSKVYLEGMIQTRKWQDKEGKDRYSTEIVLKPFRSELVLLDRAEGRPGPASEEDYGTTSTKPAAGAKRATLAEELDDGFADSEIPF